MASRYLARNATQHPAVRHSGDCHRRRQRSPWHIVPVASAATVAAITSADRQCGALLTSAAAAAGGSLTCAELRAGPHPRTGRSSRTHCLRAGARFQLHSLPAPGTRGADVLCRQGASAGAAAKRLPCGARLLCLVGGGSAGTAAPRGPFSSPASPAPDTLLHSPYQT